MNKLQQSMFFIPIQERIRDLIQFLEEGLVDSVKLIIDSLTARQISDLIRYFKAENSVMLEMFLFILNQGSTEDQPVFESTGTSNTSMITQSQNIPLIDLTCDEDSIPLIDLTIDDSTIDGDYDDQHEYNNGNFKMEHDPALNQNLVDELNVEIDRDVFSDCYDESVEFDFSTFEINRILNNSDEI